MTNRDLLIMLNSKAFARMVLDVVENIVSEVADYPEYSFEDRDAILSKFCYWLDEELKDI